MPVEELNPDIVVVVAYGKILPSDFLHFPKYGCINIHGSVLPKYRGASPIQRAIIDGETVTRDRIEFNPSKCDQCGDCIEACPYDMIHKTDNPKLPIAGFCTLCGQCIEDKFQTLSRE